MSDQLMPQKKSKKFWEIIFWCSSSLQKMVSMIHYRVCILEWLTLSQPHASLLESMTKVEACKSFTSDYVKKRNIDDKMCYICITSWCLQAKYFPVLIIALYGALLSKGTVTFGHRCTQLHGNIHSWSWKTYYSGLTLERWLVHILKQILF